MNPKPLISIIVNFYNMSREAERTLFTLSTNYQEGISADEYEVLVVENGSTDPIHPDLITNFDGNIAYHYEDAALPSPCPALNQAITRARGEYIVLLIDGARMLSPNVLSLMKSAQRLYEHCFVYTLIMHLGHERQNVNMQKGYDQNAEDAMLESIDWQRDGYELFNVSCLGGSSSEGYFGHFSESGCFMVKKSDLEKIGGYDEQFVSPGGGLASVDLFTRLQKESNIQPILLLGEATFHQFHGGISTNVPKENHPWKTFSKEYQQIRSRPPQKNTRQQFYLGMMNEKSMRFLKC